MPTPILQTLSRTAYATDGTTTAWNFNFLGGYLDPLHVKAYTETPAGVRVDVTLTPGDLIGPAQLRITPALAAGNILVIYRDTPKGIPLVNFTDEAVFTEVALDTNAKQAVFLAAESAGFDSFTPVTEVTAAIAARVAIDGRLYPTPSVTDPLTREDGSPSQVGDEYFNLVTQHKKIVRSVGPIVWEDYEQTSATFAFNATERAAAAAGSAATAVLALNNATAQAASSATQATLSGVAKVGAEAARDSAQALTKMYATTAAAIADAGLADLSYFSTPSADPNFSAFIYRKVSGAAVDTLQRVAGGQSIIQGIFPATDGATASTGVAPATLIPDTPVGLSGRVTGLSCYTINAGVAAKALVLTKNGDGTYTLNDSFDFTTVAGTNTILWNPAVTSGQYLAIYVPSGGLRYTNTTGKTLTFINGLVGTNTAVSGTSANIEIRFGWKIETGVLARAAVAEVTSITSALKVDGVSFTQGIYPATDGAFDLSSGLSIFSSTPVTLSGSLIGLSVFASGAAAGALIVASVNGDGSLKLEESKTVALTAGLNTFTNFNPHVEPGWLVGVYSVGSIRFSAGGSLFFTSGIPGAATAKTTSGNTARIGWAIQTGFGVRVTSEEARAKAFEASLQAQVTGSTATQGEFPPVSLGNVLLPGYTSFNLVPVSQDGIIAALSVYLGNMAGAGRLVVASKDASNNFTLVSSRAYNFGAGLNTITDWNPTVSAGQYIGVYTETIDGVSYTSTGGTGARFVLGLPGTATASTLLGNSAKFGIGWQVSSGTLRSGVSERSMENLKSASDGKGLLTTADSSGVADATAIFASAYTAHPNPYVPPGTYAVTALPNKGDKFYGNGRVNVNGTRYPLPLQPQDEGLLLTARARHARAISDGSALILLADSIGAHFNATSLPKHWFNRYERWVNDFVAPGGEVATVVVRNDEGTTGETAAFYGLTVSGGSNGTRGPVGKSVILAPGGYIEFTGNYAFVDAFYQQQAGAGSLAFSFNGGVAYKTVSAAGATQLDKFSGPSATGQAASGVYRITATGAAVEVTGIVRQAAVIATAGTPNRLNCMRMSYGGQQAVDFTDARVDAILTQANGIGGGSNSEVYIGLGTNDMLFGASTAAYEANMQRIITRLLAGGVTKIRALSPIRMNYSQWSTFLVNGNKFDQYVAALAKVCAANNIPLLRFDAVDFMGRGLLSSDGLHPNDAGFDLMFDMIARWKAA
jgi:hypothetical protein